MAARFLAFAPAVLLLALAAAAATQDPAPIPSPSPSTAPPALGLDFHGSYSQSRPREPVSGGHASAMGPAPAPRPEDADPGTPSPAQFEEVPALRARTYCGGRTKDHILESGGSGLALLDYDGDGLLDIYLVTAAELTPGRARVPHRNVLYRNLGQMRS